MVVQAQAAKAATTVVMKAAGVATLRGSTRKNNEDRYEIRDLSATGTAPGAPSAFVGVHDGHGGPAAAEWLSTKLWGMMEKAWRAGTRVEEATTDAYLSADKAILSTKNGFMGLGERGIGGSKCGATSATALIFQDPTTGVSKLIAANIGDARTLLVTSKGVVTQLSFDHVPDEETERRRIERTNPNPKQPLVRYVGGTWRTGGLLALSRAFGNAYLKGSLQFEGVRAGGDGYSSGFGVIAEPYITVTELGPDDAWVVVSSDGLYAEEERGGGGGLTNKQVGDALKFVGTGSVDVDKLAADLAAAAVQVGSTDDVTVVVMKLGSA